MTVPSNDEPTSVITVSSPTANPWAVSVVIVAILDVNCLNVTGILTGGSAKGTKVNVLVKLSFSKSQSILYSKPSSSLVKSSNMSPKDLKSEPLNTLLLDPKYFALNSSVESMPISELEEYEP